MLNIGFSELLIVLFILLLLFGARRLPELASGLGKAIREFRKGVSSKELEEGKEAEGKEKSHKEGES